MVIPARTILQAAILILTIIIIEHYRNRQSAIRAIAPCLSVIRSFTTLCEYALFYFDIFTTSSEVPSV